MNIGFDAKRFFLNRSGLGNYSRWLVNGLLKRYPQESYHLYTPQVNNTEQINELNNLNSNVKIHFPSNLFKTFWRTKGIKKDLLRHSIGVYHGLSNEIPYGIEKTSIKSIVTIHDLIFKIHPEFYNPIDRKIYDTKFKSACERADKIVAISEHTRQLIVDLYQIPTEKTEVIYMDTLPVFHQTAEANDLLMIKAKYGINRPFFLNVGSGGGRKNHPRLCKAYAEVSGKIEQDLVIVGKKGNDYEQISKIIKDHKLQDRIHWFEHVSDFELYHLYNLSYATLYPSLYEGFGIPIIESFRCGKPVLTSYGSSLEEVAGNAGLKCDPLSTEDMATNIALLTEKSTYESLTSLIPLELQRFDNQNLIDKYYKVYNELNKQ